MNEQEALKACKKAIAQAYTNEQEPLQETRITMLCRLKQAIENTRTLLHMQEMIAEYLEAEVKGKHP